MIEFTRNEVSTCYQARVPAMAQPEKREWRGRCPVHNGTGNNFAVQSDTGLANCHSQCGRGWDMIGLEMELSGSDFATAKAAIFELVGRPEPAWEDRDVEAAYDYRDESGRLIYQVVRKHGKKFIQRRPYPNGGKWIWNLKDTSPLPYRLPELIASPFIALVEGEKDADNLHRLGIPATCNSGGAGKFSRELIPWFSGKQIAIFPDQDVPGRQHALAVAEMLSEIATVKIIELPDLPAKGDVSDFLAAGGTVEQLRTLYRQSAEFSDTFEFLIPLEEPGADKTPPHLPAGDGAGRRTRELLEFASSGGNPYAAAAIDPRIRRRMRDGEVYVIGANQGAGKTSLALQFALEVLRRNMGVLYFSMEMGARDVFQRLASIEAKVDLLEFRDLRNTYSKNPAVSEASLGWTWSSSTTCS
jgi:hypothetical protein